MWARCAACVGASTSWSNASLFVRCCLTLFRVAIELRVERKNSRRQSLMLAANKNEEKTQAKFRYLFSLYFWLASLHCDCCSGSWIYSTVCYRIVLISSTGAHAKKKWCDSVTHVIATAVTHRSESFSFSLRRSRRSRVSAWIWQQWEKKLNFRNNTSSEHKIKPSEAARI